MEKPKSVSVKDFLIRKMSVKMLIPEFTLDAVVSHQFQSANQAMLNSKSIEISGFGRFIFNDKKALKKMEKYVSQRNLFERMMNDETLSTQKRNNAKLKYETALLAINTLKPRITNNETKSNLSGMEEQFVSPSNTEGSDTDNV